MAVWLLVAAIAVQAQNRLSLSDALQIAGEHNGTVRTATLAVQQAGQLQRTAWNIGQTNILLQRGQTNSELTDNFWTFTQNIGSPTEHIARRRWLGEQQQLAVADQQVTRSSLVRDVTGSYYEWLWLYHRRKVLEQNAALYQEADRIAQVRYQTGESNYLSKTVIQTRAKDLQTQVIEAGADLDMAALQFNRLLFGPESYLPDTLPLSRIPPAFPEAELRTRLSAGPLVQAAEQRVRTATAALRTEKARLSPGLVLGYYNQQLNHVAGFQGLLAGVNIPLFFHPQRAFIQAAKIQQQSAQIQAQYLRFSIEKEADILLARIRRFDARIRYSEEYALPQADSILDNAGKLFRNGEIQYIEYLQNVSEAFAIRLTYLDQLNLYNQSVIQLNYLLNP